MASIRRTQSPAYRDRCHTNGETPFTIHSPSHKSLYASYSPSSNYLSKQSIFHNLKKKLVSGIFLQRQSRKPNHFWKWSLHRFLLCFMLGFLYGLSPFWNDNVLFLMRPPQGQELSGVISRRNVVLKSVNLGLETRKPEEAVEDKFDIKPRKQLIVVTPTFNRALQGYYLNRLGQVLRLVLPPVLWIVVEMNEQEDETAEILRKIGVMNRHLVCKKNSTNVKNRGVHQRNTALEHIERHRLDGIVYFADDDNIYSLELFESLREIRRFGTWPVAMLAQSKSKAILEGPVCNGSQVIGWHTNEKSKRLRRFHVDMSGFAFNSTILWAPKRWNRTTLHPVRQLDTVKEGFQETTFIEQVVENEFQMEGLPYGCGRVMNWHLHLEAHNLVYPKRWLLPNDLDVILPLDDLQLQNI